MTLLKKLYEESKDLWFTRLINGYKGPVYYRFIDIGNYGVEIVMLRYYPKNKKWQKDVLSTVEYLDKLEIVEDEKTLALLDSEYALLLLTAKDKPIG